MEEEAIAFLLLSEYALGCGLDPVCLVEVQWPATPARTQ